jgi:signal transduction histidine kinase
VRRIAAALRPGLLDQLGLEAALRQELRALEARTGLSCALALSGPAPALRAEQATALYRIAQEALTNVVRHAGARRVTLRLSTAAGAVRLEVEDDGRGLGERAAGAVTLGLAGMRERARRLGGELVLGPGRAGGTLVSATIPA